MGKQGSPENTHTHILQQAGSLEQARGAYERAAQSQERIGSGWHAAKHLETAAQLSRDLGEWPAVAEFARQAGQQYAQAGRPLAGAGWGGFATGSWIRMFEVTVPGTAVCTRGAAAGSCVWVGRSVAAGGL